MAYDVSGHPLLSDAAGQVQADDADGFDEIVEAASDMLDLPTGLTGKKKSRARVALTRQVNLIVERGPEAGLLASKKQGDRSWSWKSEGQMEEVDPIADKIAEDLRVDEEAADGSIYDTAHVLR